MPLGVDHAAEWKLPLLRLDVILPLMPLGVDHTLTRSVIEMAVG